MTFHIALVDIQVSNLQRLMGPWHSKCFVSILVDNMEALKKIRVTKAEIHSAMLSHEKPFQTMARMMIRANFGASFGTFYFLFGSVADW